MPHRRSLIALDIDGIRLHRLIAGGVVSGDGTLGQASHVTVELERGRVRVGDVPLLNIAVHLEPGQIIQRRAVLVLDGCVPAKERRTGGLVEPHIPDVKPGLPDWPPVTIAGRRDQRAVNVFIAAIRGKARAVRHLAVDDVAGITDNDRNG